MNILIGNSRIAACEIVKFSDLARQQQERAIYLKSRFKDGSSSLVSLLDVRGKNSWLMVDNKLKKIKEATYEVQNYHNFITDNFELGTVYSLSDILSTVAEIRGDLGMPSPLSRLQATCETDFLSLFIVDDVYNDCVIMPDGKKQFINFIGYMPTFKLKPQD
jgi:hypothetical protein